MTTNRRLQAAGATLALLTAATCSTVWGDPPQNPLRKPDPLASSLRVPPTADTASPADTSGRFSQQPVFIYQMPQGETHFALQVRPQLPAATARPRDIAVVIDTSASQVGHVDNPLRNARRIAEELTKAARTDDRISLWVINIDNADITRSLTAGFRAPKDQRVANALDYLANQEYAAGVTDLKSGLRRVLRDFDGGATRQQVILFLGDGESLLNPLDNGDRSALAAEMAAREVAFFPVPLGTRLNPDNLHGLASGTGGAVVRLQGEESVEKFLPRLTAAFEAPVFYPSRAPAFSAEVIEGLPNRLPPLRGDSPTLVAGLMKSGAATVGLSVEGTVAGRKTTVEVKETVPAADVTNYFLISLVHQWRKADRSAPALIRADRGLALAYETTRLTREELLAQAHWSLSQNHLDAAAKLFHAAQKIDPRDAEPAAGLRIIGKLQDGQITREDIRKQLSDPNQIGVKINHGEVARGQLVKLTQDPQLPPAAQPPAVGGPPAAQPPALGQPTPLPAQGDLLNQEQRLRQVREQQAKQVVDDTIARGKQLIYSDPDAAYDLLKRQLTSIRENTELSDRVRGDLAGRLESSLRWSVAEGTLVKQRQEAELQRRITEEARRAALNAQRSEEEAIRERIRAFGVLMQQGRDEEAYKEALVLQQEQLAKGRPVPVAATAAYQIGLNSANLREFQELVRTKEDRFLLTMLQVERSHIPFPDEPPVAFPPAATWRELSNYRKERYDSIGLEGVASRSALQMRDKMLRPVSLDKEIPGAPLRDVLAILSDKYELTFIVDTKEFENAGGNANVEDTNVRLPKMPNVSLGVVLRFLLAQLPGDGTFIIRRDYVEITTKNAAAADKAIRAYPVADLVIPIPNSVNQQGLQQNLTVLGSSLSAAGMALFGQGSLFGALGGAGGGLGFAGQLGALGVLGPLGALGAGGGVGLGGGFGGAVGIGGGIGGIGIGAGIAGAGATGAGFSGALGFAGGNNQTNLGFGGGVLGFGGGQQGQFGNLGGQFGLQGGNTSGILIQLIEDVIAPREWIQTAARYLFNNLQTQPDEETPLIDQRLLNSLGFYPPANALVVRGTSRINPRYGAGALGSSGPARAANAGKPGGDALVIRPGDSAKAKADAVVKAAPKAADPPKAQPTAVVKERRDPTEVWNKAMEEGKLKPRDVIAAAHALAGGDKFDHVATLLKADLRKGVLIQPCVFEALAMALKESGGSAAEIERARLSIIDLDPQNPNSYMAAAAAMHDLGKPDQALAFCKRAAALEPNASDPYAKSLVYLAKATNVDTDAVQWAAGNLLGHEWSVDRELLQSQARQALDAAVQRLRASGRTADADRMQSAIDRNRQRDLVIELLWSDEADLDLEVTEPGGGVCSPVQPQSTGGGVWRGDRLLAKDRAEKYLESYVAAEAFAGTYEVRVKSVWGKPLGGKATIRITKNQGTPQQTQELHRVELGTDGTASVKVQLASGRRSDAALVPPPAPRRSEPAARPVGGPDRVFNLLRAMSEPAYAGMSKQAMIGMTGGPTTQVTDAGRPIGSEVIHQNRLASSNALLTGAEMVGRAVVSADGRELTMSLTPVFQTASDMPEVKLPLIPGGN
jgi:hypothetical protein